VTVSAFIEDDGYTETKFVKGVFQLYPAVRIKFRPIPTTDQAVAVERLQELARKHGAARAEKEMAEQIAKRTISIEIIGDEGNVIQAIEPVTAAQILKVKPALFVRLNSIVFYGSDGGDPDPTESESSTEPAETQLEADLKN
jgi:hypothetical protein